MNEMINAVRYDRVLDFRERYRSVDVLLVDDIQFLAGKEGTQTEFFHTFNALYDSQKQIVISSDCPPHEIPRSRSACGRASSGASSPTSSRPTSRRRSPSSRRRPKAEGVPLPDNVALYIAGKIKSNIRELEGSLIRLIAYASLTGRRSRCRSRRTSCERPQHDERAVTIEVIQKFVADYYQLKRQRTEVAQQLEVGRHAAQIAMYLCKT
jgi:chromosomal replication initiator protein